MPRSNLWTRFQAECFQCYRKSWQLRESFFPRCAKEDVSPVSPWITAKLELAGLGWWAWSPRTVTSRQSGFPGQSCRGSRRGLRGSRERDAPRERWDAPEEHGTVPVTRASSSCILRKSFLRFWVCVYRHVMELIIAKRFLEILLSGPSFSDDKSDPQSGEAQSHSLVSGGLGIRPCHCCSGSVW